MFSMIRRGRREEEQETESLRVHNERDVTINGAQPLWAKPTASPFTWGTNAILIAMKVRGQFARASSLLPQRGCQDVRLGKQLLSPTDPSRLSFNGRARRVAQW